MFDYARITAIHDYLKRRFADGIVRCFADRLSRQGDAHAFEIHTAQGTHRLKVAHEFLGEFSGDLAAYLDANRIPAMLRESTTTVLVTTRGAAPARDVAARSERMEAAKREIAAYAARRARGRRQ